MTEPKRYGVPTKPSGAEYGKPTPQGETAGAGPVETQRIKRERLEEIRDAQYVENKGRRGKPRK